MISFCVSLTNVKHSHGVCQHFNRKIQVLLLYIKTLGEAMVIDCLILHHDPLWDNDHWFPHVHIKTLYEAMVIDFLMFTSRPSTRQWSLIFFVTSRPSTREWSLISLCLYQVPLQGNGHWFSLHRGPLCGNGHWFVCHIEAIYEAMVIDSFTSRPSVRQWSLISLSHWGPLRGNSHWFLYIKAFCEPIVIDFFVTSRPSALQRSSISLHQDPLCGNGH